MVAKSDLTARTRGKGGTMVRISTDALDRRYTALSASTFFAPWADSIRYDDRTWFVVKDLFDRKSYDRPDHVGVGLPDSGLTFGVLLSDIVEIGS